MTQLNVNLDYEELASAIFGSDMNASMKTIAMTVINAYMEMERDKYGICPYNCVIKKRAIYSSL